jgi:hypothetical protein
MEKDLREILKKTEYEQYKDFIFLIAEKAFKKYRKYEKFETGIGITKTTIFKLLYYEIKKFQKYGNNKKVLQKYKCEAFGYMLAQNRYTQKLSSLSSYSYNKKLIKKAKNYYYCLATIVYTAESILNNNISDIEYAINCINNIYKKDIKKIFIKLVER